MDQDSRVVESVALEPAEGQQVHLRLWQMVQRRKWRITLGAVIGLCLAIVFCALLGPWYESTAQLLIVKKHLDTSPILGPNQDHPPEEYLSTHLQILSSPRVVGQAVTQGHLLSLESFQKKDGGVKDALSRFLPKAREVRPEDRVTKEIIDALTVNRDTMKPGIAPSNEILTVTFRGHSADDCPKVLSAIIASYQGFLKDTYRDANKETLELITQAQKILKDDVDANLKEYSDFLQKYPLVWKGKEGNTIYQERLFAIDARRTPLRMRQVEIEVTLAAIDEALKSGQSRALLENLISELLTNQQRLIPSTVLNNTEASAAGQPPRVTPDQLLDSLKLEEERLKAKLGRNHPDLQALRSRIASLRAKMLPSPAGQGKQAKESSQDEDLVDLKLNLLRQELAIIKVADGALKELFEREQKEAQTAFLHYTENENRQKTLQSSHELYESVIHRLREINSVQDFGGYDTYLIGEPKPGKWALKRYGLIAALGVFTGLLGGLASAYRAEIVDKSFRTPSEIRHRLRLPVLGQMPSLAAGKKRWERVNGKALDPLLCSYHHPQSPEAEAYRAVRAALYFSTRAHGHQVIQITSPDQGDGKTTLAGNLAVSIAQSGNRVLLIDANLRKPRLDKVFGLPNRVGLSSVLNGQAELMQAVQPSVVSGLAILPSGQLPPNAAELLSPPRLKDLLDSLRQTYDCVLVDTPPLLAVADSSMVGAQVDAVLLVIKNSANSRPQAERALERLDTLQARVLGVVVNAVGHRFGTMANGYAYHSPAMKG